MPATTETRKIIIKVDAPGTKEALDSISKSMGNMNKSTKSLAGNMSLLTGLFTTFVGFLGVREIANLADGMTNLSNRLKITALAGENTSDTLDKIAALADRTKTSIANTGEVYNRFAISLGKVNPKANELISLTETLSNTFRTSGSTSAETSATIVQLSQAFSLGTLRGQELRSVLSQNGVLARILNKEFGADLFKKAEAGAIRASTVVGLLAKNFEKIEADAAKLGPTFENTLVLALNKVTVQIGKLNEEYKLNVKFASFMEVATNNLGSALTLLAGAAIVGLIVKIGELGIALKAFATLNPVTAIIAGVVLGMAALTKAIITIQPYTKLLGSAFSDFAATIEEKLLPVFLKIQKLNGSSSGDFEARAKNDIKVLRDQAAILRLEAGELLTPIEKLKLENKKKIDKGGQKQDLEKLARKLANEEKANKPAKIKEILGALNKELILGKTSLSEYNDKLIHFNLYKLKREFEEGKFDIFTFNKQLKELNIEKLNRELVNGSISFRKFNDFIESNNLRELNARFVAGKISLIEYNKELIKITEAFLPGSALIVGTSNYIESIGTLSENIARGITKTFSLLEDNLVDFVKKGEFNFAKMTEAILDDLTRIIIRASILGPLAKGILGATVNGQDSGTGGGTITDTTAAKGASFYEGNLRKFARGGLVNSPTAFQYGGGRRGLMGEAGTEAIIPLKRASNGDLGVAGGSTPVTVNIINQSGSSVDQRESTGPGGEKTIDILISNKVREGISTGKFDSAFKGAYGLSRKGS